jgi:hypothetical protein
MKIIETRQKAYEHRGRSFPATEVMTEGVVDDVAVYQTVGFVSGEEAAERGVKLTEREAGIAGWTVPEGKHYRR